MAHEFSGWGLFKREKSFGRRHTQLDARATRLMDTRHRLDATLCRMTADGIEALVACSNGLHMPDRPDPVAHLSGYRSLGESLFLLRAGGASKLIVSPSEDAERAAAWAGPGDALATDHLSDALTREVEFCTAMRARRSAIVGIDTIPHALAEALLGHFERAVTDFDDAFYGSSARKTSAEIGRAQCAAAIAEQGLEYLLELARPGVRECDLAVQVNCYMKSLGADDNFLMLCASPHNPAVMPSSTRKIERGDILIAELTPSFEGQFVQICRTVAIGPPRAELQGKYDLVTRAMREGIDTIRPGVPMSRVCAAIDNVIASAGYADYCRPPYMRRRGHGLGEGSVAPGDVATANHTVLAEDMIFVVHPNQYFPETGYLMCGEPVRVTAAGAETLSRKTASLTILAGS